MLSEFFTNASADVRFILKRRVKFATSAPPEVVAEAQTNLDARQEEADQLQAALNRLAELD